MVTAAPTSSTMPTYSCPIVIGPSTGSAPRYGHKSDPQMHDADKLMTASLGFSMVGSGRSSTRTSPGAYIIVARIIVLLRKGAGQFRRGLTVQVTPFRRIPALPVQTCTGGASHAGNARRSVVEVDNRTEVREFLLSRRAKITPQQAGLPDIGQRRVPGLRRGEVAALAGVSVEYYAKLERGSLGGVSPSVLDALARALQLDDAERAHLFHLAHAADGTSAGMRPRRRPSIRWTPRPALQWVLDGINPPAIIRNGRMDLLATNHLGRAMHASVYDSQPGGTPNFARYTFLDEDSRRFYPDWDTAANTCVAILRTEAGRDPHDKALHDLVGELSTRSSDFRRRWGSHDVRLHGAGSKNFHHTTVGNLELAYESVDMISDPGLTMTIYVAEPASPTAHALDLLASWDSAPNITETHLPT